VACIRLRDAVIGDAPEIARVHVASWRVAYRGMIPDEVLDGLSVAERTERWYERLEQGTTTLVALSDTALVGFCALRRGAGGPVEIGALYLDPEVLRQGIGTRLIRETLRRLRADGEREVTLGVLAGNVRARAFYARLGFEEIGEDEAFLGARQLRMRLPLTS